MSAERLASPVRYALALLLLVLSLVATVHFSLLYGQRRLFLGLSCTVLLGALLCTGAVSFALARRRIAAELRALAQSEGMGDLGWSLVGRRRAELRALAARGGRPDLGALAQRAGAAVGRQAYLGRYFVAVAVLVGLLGTFAGLMETLTGVSALLKDEGDRSLHALLLLFSAPLAGLEVAFGASMVGILITVTLALMQGDLALAEDHLLAELEAHTAHELIPALWPPAEEPAQRAQREIAGLRADLAGLIDKVAAAQEAGQRALQQAGERGVSLLAAQAAEGQRLLAAHAERTAEALARHEGQVADQLDTRVRQTHEALSVQVRRLLGGVEGAVQQLADAAAQREQRRDEALRLLVEELGAAVGRMTREAGQALAEHAAVAAQASSGAAGEVARTAAGLIAGLTDHGRQLTADLSAATARIQDAAERAIGATAAEALATAGAATDRAAAAAAGAVGRAAAAAERTAAQALATAEKAVGRSVQAAQAAQAETTAATRAAGEQLAHYAEALQRAEAERTRVFAEGEQQRQSDHEALRQRLEAFLEQGVAAPLAAHLLSWEQAAGLVSEASDRLAASAQALGEGAARFGAGAADLSPPLLALAPELSALSAEVALLLSRSNEEVAAPPQLLAELIRLTDTIERLERRLAEGVPVAPADHQRPPMNGEPPAAEHLRDSGGEAG